MHFFILKPKMTSVFFSDRPFRRGTVFHKNWQYRKMGYKNSISQIGTGNTPCDISNASSFITDLKSHTKTKIGGHSWPQASKIGLRNPKIVLKAYFRPLGAQWPLIFVFVWFLIRDKRQSVWYTGGFFLRSGTFIFEYLRQFLIFFTLKKGLDSFWAVQFEGRN